MTTTSAAPDAAMIERATCAANEALFNRPDYKVRNRDILYGISHGSLVEALLAFAATERALALKETEKASRERDGALNTIAAMKEWQHRVLDKMKKADVSLSEESECGMSERLVVAPEVLDRLGISYDTIAAMTISELINLVLDRGLDIKLLPLETVRDGTGHLTITCDPLDNCDPTPSVSEGG